MTNEKRIYTIATAHLDTVWNWDFEHVLSTCIPATIYDNLRCLNSTRPIVSTLRAPIAMR